MTRTQVASLRRFARRGSGTRRARAIFDEPFYLQQLGDLPRPAMDPFRHYVRVGAWLGLDPHPLFDSAFYLEQFPDVASAGINPLVHYVTDGAQEGRDPHPLFDTSYYLAHSSDVAASRSNALLHYLEVGASEDRSPHPLFDAPYVVAQAPATRGRALLAHLLAGPDVEADPNPWFDNSFYRARYPEVAEVGLAPVLHYVRIGAKRGFDPHPRFDTAFYREQHPDVPPEHVLIHHLTSSTGDPTSRLETLPPDAPPSDDPALPRSVRPLHLRVHAGPSSPRLNLLLPNLTLRSLTGGPNTAIRLAAYAAVAGIDVRLVATDYPVTETTDALASHAARLIGETALGNVDVVDASQRTTAVDVTDGDVFLATSWWTAQLANVARETTGRARFLYLVQDFEPIFYPASTEYALALETYDFPFVPIVNSTLLLDDLVDRRVGRFADAPFAADALAFDPIPDPKLFRPEPRSPARSRRALFYARPSVSRNLSELGLAALRRAARLGAFDEETWELRSIGDAVPVSMIDAARTIDPLGWPPLDEWARTMRESDLLVSLILSPHPSYPPLEMAACGGLVVTNTFGPKTAARLAAYGSTFNTAPATVTALSDAIVDAVRRLPEIDAARSEPRAARAPAADAFGDVARAVVEMLRSGGP